MFKGRGKKRRGPIGLDIGTCTVRMIQLERCGAGWAVVHAAEQPLDPIPAEDSDVYHKAVAEALKQMLDVGGFHGRRVVSCLPAYGVSYKNIRVPCMPADELAQAVKWEAADRLHLPADSFAVQFFDAGQVRQGEEIQQEIILLAASNDAIQKHVDLLLSVGLKPCVLEVAPCALTRWAQLYQNHTPDQPDQADVILDMGYTTSKILVCRQGQILFYKQVPIGGRQINETLAAQLKLSQEEASRLRQDHARATSAGLKTESVVSSSTAERAIQEAMRLPAAELSRELGLCLRYFSVTFRGRRPETAWVTGGQAGDGNWRYQVSEGAGIELQVAPALQDIDLKASSWLESQQGSHQAWAQVAGLAMHPFVGQKVWRMAA